MEFAGIPMDAFAFLFELRLNNNKAFFEANRERFNKNVRDPLRLLAQGLEPTLRDIDPGIITAPSACVSRIYRDTRFSSDKTPYRDHMWLGYKHDGEPLSEGFIYYFEISPEHYAYGCGTYGPLPKLMESVRTRARAESAYLTEVLNGLDANGFELLGEDYKRPKETGAPKELGRLLNKKGFYVSKQGSALKNACEPGLLEELKQGFRDLEPIYRFAHGLTRK